MKGAIEREFPKARVQIVRETDKAPADANGFEILVANHFPPGMLTEFGNLRWLHLTSAGTDQIPSAPGEFFVTRSASVPAQAVAEFVWMGLLALAKEAPRLVRAQDQRRWELPDATLVAGSHLLLVGLGHIGRAVARRARSFDVSVTAITRRAEPSTLVTRVLPLTQLVDAARSADFLVIAVPGNSSTQHLVDERVLSALPTHACVVNVARASVLQTPALLQALRQRRLRAALLDVHDSEPLPPDSPLWTVPNLWVTPHGAYRYPGEERAITELFVRNFRRFMGGAPLEQMVHAPTRPDMPQQAST